MDTEDDRWETWGIAARWDVEHGWHDPTTEEQLTDATA